MLRHIDSEETKTAPRTRQAKGKRVVGSSAKTIREGMAASAGADQSPAPRLSKNGRPIRVGAVVMGAAGEYGRVEHVAENVVVFRLLPGQGYSGPMSADFNHKDVTVIADPDELAAAPGQLTRPDEPAAGTTSKRRTAGESPNARNLAEAVTFARRFRHLVEDLFKLAQRVNEDITSCDEELIMALEKIEPQVWEFTGRIAALGGGNFYDYNPRRGNGEQPCATAADREAGARPVTATQNEGAIRALDMHGRLERLHADYDDLNGRTPEDATDNVLDKEIASAFAELSCRLLEFVAQHNTGTFQIDPAGQEETPVSSLAGRHTTSN